MQTLNPSDMKCPHCLTEFHDQVQYFGLGKDIDGEWAIMRYTCPLPKCKKAIYYLVNGTFTANQFGTVLGIKTITSQRLIYPKGTNRQPAPPEVPKEYLDDYNEACLVLADSSKASAALSRRCLQHILREKGKFIAKNLSQEIQMAIDSKTLPSFITESMDAVRNIGNFAAHPQKSTNSGEILSVEPGEAEWNLDVIEFLFDFYFVQPAIIQKKKDSLNQKLTDAGKPKMK